MKSAVKTVLSSLKRAPAAARPAVDFPAQNETILSSHYTIRLSAPEKTETVDLSINQGPWLACRKAEGFWWYDWSGYGAGTHEVIARTPGKNGRFLMSAPVEFEVLPS